MLRELKDIEDFLNSYTLKDELTPTAINGVINSISRMSPSDAEINLNARLSQIGASLGVIKQRVSDALKNLGTRVNQASNVNNAANDLYSKMADLQEKKKTLSNVGSDLSTAYTREAVVDTKDAAVSYQQTWGMIQRPIRRQSIPVLIVFTLLFLTAAGLGIWYLSPFASAAAADSVGSMPSLFQSPVIWFSSVVLLICAVIFGVFAVLGLI